MAKAIVQINKLFFPKAQDKIKELREDGGYLIGLFSVIGVEGENVDLKTQKGDILAKEVGIKLGEKVKFKGNFPSLEMKEEYVIEFNTAEQTDYGITYLIDSAKTNYNLNNPNEFKGFLCHIAGEKIGNLLLSTFGEDTYDIIKNKEVEKLTEIKGIQTKKANTIIKKFHENQSMGALFSLLIPLGVTPTMIAKISSTFGDKALNIIKKDTYRLTEITGVGFKKADEIALKVKYVTPTSPLRYEACIDFILKRKGSEGESYIETDILYALVQEQIGLIDNNAYLQACQTLKQKELVKITENGTEVGAISYYNLETYIYNQLIRLSEGEDRSISNFFEGIDVERYIAKTEAELGFAFNKEQKQAITDFARGGNIICLTGQSGSGKSTVTRALCNICGDSLSVGCCALSGRASLRLQQATGREASTIHRMLNSFPDIENPETGEMETQKLPYDVLFIDEATMVGGGLFLRLISKLKSGAKLTIIGDNRQLQPIGACRVYGDLLEIPNNLSTKTTLKKAMRQSGEKGILELAYKILDKEIKLPKGIGEMVFGEDEDTTVTYFDENTPILLQTVLDKFNYYYEKENGDIKKIQILGATREIGALSCLNVNRYIQEALNPRDSFTTKDDVIPLAKETDINYRELRVGDRVLNTVNTYQVQTNAELTPEQKKLNEGSLVDIFNGDFGIITSIDKEFVTVKFDNIDNDVILGRHEHALELGYCATTSKMQGSEAKNVIVALDNGSYMLQTNEWLYTAVTRAREYCEVVCLYDSFNRCVTTRETLKKRTYLAKFLKEERNIKKRTYLAKF